MKLSEMNLPVALVLIALVGAGTVGGYFFYQEYRENNAYERKLAGERMDAEEREARREREEERRQEMYDIASGAAEWIVTKSYGGGRAIDWDVNSWNYNDYKGEYKIDISINWEGKNFGGYYEDYGVRSSIVAF